MQWLLASIRRRLLDRFDQRGVRLCSGSLSRRGMHRREGTEDQCCEVLPDEEPGDECLCFSCDPEDYKSEKLVNCQIEWELERFKIGIQEEKLTIIAFFAGRIFARRRRGRGRE